MHRNAILGLCTVTPESTISVINVFRYLQTGRSVFLDIGILSGFATVALSFLGFKFRFSDWFPNRNYITGNI